MTFAVVVALVGLLGGAMAAVSGAGIGSTLVPLLALRMDFRAAVVVAAIPHLVGGAARAVHLWRAIDRKLLLRFGVVCAIASLGGALLHARAGGAVITYVFAALLVLAGLFAVTGVGEKLRLGHRGGAVAGAASGFFGGLTGEQGGLRAIGLLGFDLDKDAFVATSAAIGVLIDLVRTPIYFATDAHAMADHAGLIAIASIGSLAGIALGHVFHVRVPERAFRRVIGAILVALGGLLLAHA